jgi:hypothetical protein
MTTFERRRSSVDAKDELHEREDEDESQQGGEASGNNRAGRICIARAACELSIGPATDTSPKEQCNEKIRHMYQCNLKR